MFIAVINLFVHTILTGINIPDISFPDAFVNKFGCFLFMAITKIYDGIVSFINVSMMN